MQNQTYSYKNEIMGPAEVAGGRDGSGRTQVRVQHRQKVSQTPSHSVSRAWWCPSVIPARRVAAWAKMPDPT
jgi:hypothetical protein